VKDSKLLSKVGVVCMTRYLTNLLESAYDLGELDLASIDAIERRVGSVIQLQKKEFWTQEWVSKSYDTSAGHKIVIDSLVQVSRNLRAGIDWKDDVQIFGKESEMHQET
jgi:hypothetical protein